VFFNPVETAMLIVNMRAAGSPKPKPRLVIEGNKGASTAAAKNRNHFRLPATLHRLLETLSAMDGMAALSLNEFIAHRN
jgi:hypothetical protein